MLFSKKNLLTKLVLGFLILVTSSVKIHSAHADDEGPFSRNCTSYASTEDFVKKSTLYCINQAHSRLCNRQAQTYFTNCHYEGNYMKLSNKVQKDLLLMVVFARGPELKKYLNSKG